MNDSFVSKRFAAGWAAVFCHFAVATAPAAAAAFRFPTSNEFLFNAPNKFYAPTPGKAWSTGQFGCVRSEGTQFHEGLDILALERDRLGEPADPVRATADGVVAYTNRKPSLSNYGNYIILRHSIEGFQIYSLYAHLGSIHGRVQAGASVRAGDPIGVLGRTANTRQGISKDRAHVHFELNLLLNDRYPDWHRSRLPDQRNDHGVWNGRNLIGINPSEVFQAQRREGARFSFSLHLRNQEEAFRVRLAGAKFPWINRYSGLLATPLPTNAAPIAFDVSFNGSGLPFRLLPRGAEIAGKLPNVQLLRVNEAALEGRRCRSLVVKRDGRWQLGANGSRLIDLLVF